MRQVKTSAGLRAPVISRMVTAPPSSRQGGMAGGFGVGQAEGDRVPGVAGDERASSAVAEGLDGTWLRRPPGAAPRR
jgi:hypothetical protein